MEDVKIEAAYNQRMLLNLPGMISSRKTNVFKTDAAGNFAVKIKEADVIDLQILKQGYLLDPNARLGFALAGNYSSIFVPDPTNPVIYTMWKWHGAAHLAEKTFKVNLRADGTPVTFDFQSGGFVIGQTNTTGPTLRVWRDPLVFDHRTAPIKEWHYELVWPNGKICPAKDAFPYLAPKDGYLKKVGAQFKAGEGDFGYDKTFLFYFINEAGQFGNGSLEIIADWRGEDIHGAQVSLSVSWNPDGSRNLEPPH